MRRIIHNTTAIAACLSLMAPHLAMAQTVAPETGAEIQEQPAEASPQQGDAPAPADATCEDGSQPPCADVAADAADEAEEPAEEVAPAEEAAPAEESQDAAAEAPEAEAPAEAAEEQPQDEAAEAPEAEAAEASQPDADPATDDAEPETPAEEPEAEAAAPADSDAAMEAPEADVTAEPETAEPETAESEADADATGSTDPLAEALAEEAEDQPAEATEPDAASEATQPDAATEAEQPDAAAAQPDEGADESASDDTTSQDAAEADAAETDAAEPDAAQADAAESDAADPATDEDALAKALAEKAEEEDAATDTDAAAEAQTDADQAETGNASDARTDDAEQIPEADAAPTEAAKEAAEASEAPTAAALDADASDAEVVEETVTDENSRSSSEDFATSLRDAVEGATGQQSAEQAAEAREDDDDDDNTLTKALLLGAGALAVGAILNNNRQVALSTPDRVVVTRPDGSQQIIKDEVALLRQPGSTVTTENFDDGSSRTIVTRADGSRVVTIRDADLRVLRRTLVSPDGSSVQLIDDTAAATPVELSSLPAPAPAANNAVGQMSEEQLRDALLRESNVDRRFSLAQIRDIPQVRSLVAPVNIDAITFDTGSAAIKPDQARQLQTLGNVIREAVSDNPRELFLIEGHTDTVGSDAANLALSDRRAESVALALTEYFDVPPENLVVQGYGEQFLKVRQEGDVRENRRASVRRITDLIQQASN
ncbi:OmpA family protein [Paracoccus stylophorae]|uniref:OmpA family protein n=1 Tax=Paracoccus stylophorae TaxID=659350 RepID=A0ABY7SYE7_9RHOB|nr:OmpA family protein [Paracoccus stylophorae]WCR11271.1 OmpA family protein [Paracoccus stylophorae]